MYFLKCLLDCLLGLLLVRESGPGYVECLPARETQPTGCVFSALLTGGAGLP